MRMLYFRISGYKRLVTGMSQSSIEIDFTKSMHKIINIVGPNGSGKSTLINALSPMPDGNENFIEHQSASKEIVYDNGYSILIVHPVDSRGNRVTTKAFIKKNGIELNPNGNVSSYKSILETELGLDSNFLVLSKLSADDKGIAVRKPAEKKKFLASTLSGLDLYNDIYKTMVKRTSILKPMIDSITEKMNNIGSIDVLNNRLQSISNRISSIELDKDDIIKSNHEYEFKIEQLDPSKEIQNEYNKISLELNNLSNQLKSYTDINKHVADIINEIKIDTDRKKVLTSSIEEINISIEKLLREREEESHFLQLKLDKVNSLKSDINISILEDGINNTKSQINMCEETFSSMNINPDEFTKDEFISGINVIEDIISSIDILKSSSSKDELEEACNAILNNYSLSDKKTHLEGVLNSLEIDLSNAKARYNELLILEEKAKGLSKRDKDCTFNSCPYIKDAYEASKLYNEEEANTLKQSISSYESDINSIKITIDTTYNAILYYNQIKNILRNINSYKNTLSKLPNFDMINSIEVILDKIRSNDSFNELKIISSYRDNANLLEIYKKSKESLNNLNQDYNNYMISYSIIQELNQDIDKLNKKVNDISASLDEKNNILQSSIDELKCIEINLNTNNSILERARQKEHIELLLEEHSTSISKLEQGMKDINKYLSFISKNNIKLEDIEKTLKTLYTERDNTLFNIKQIEEYSKEYQSYKEQYDILETIKKYSSPTQGIQLLFMELYMGTTLEMSNQLLSNLFGGNLILKPYIINESEFRIPCMNNMIDIDDISSLSLSQLSMVSMIISAVMLKQSATVYNILRLDEIDSGLDYDNRMKFASIIEQVIDLLDIDQLIIVSHNTELNDSNMDIIRLGNNNAVYYGNFIYDAVSLVER